MEREPSREALQRPGSQTHQVHPIPLDSEEFNKVPNVQGLHVIKARSCVITFLPQVLCFTLLLPPYTSFMKDTEPDPGF